MSEDSTKYDAPIDIKDRVLTDESFALEGVFYGYSQRLSMPTFTPQSVSQLAMSFAVEMVKADKHTALEIAKRSADIAQACYEEHARRGWLLRIPAPIRKKEIKPPGFGDA